MDYFVSIASFYLISPFHSIFNKKKTNFHSHAESESLEAQQSCCCYYYYYLLLFSEACFQMLSHGRMKALLLK